MVVVYALMVTVGLVALYAILNAGNPRSLLRPLFPDPAYDVHVALAASLAVFILGFVVFFNRDQEGFRRLIELNADRIRSMRRKGRDEGEIADAMLAAMGSSSGYRHRLARKKLLIYLSEFK